MSPFENSFDAASVNRGAIRGAKVTVFFFVPSLAGGGAERVVTNIIRGLDRSRFTAVVVLVVDGDNVLQDRIPSDVEVISLNASRLRHAIFAMAKLIWARKPQIVFSTIDHLNIALGLMKPILPADSRVVVRMTDFHSLTRRGFRRLLGLALPQVDGIIYQSEDMHYAFESLAGRRPRGLVIPNPVDMEEIQKLALRESDTKFQPERIELVACGRLTPNKGFDLLIEALAIIPDSRVHLTILGTGDDRTLLAELAERLQVANRVTFRGYCRNPYPYFAKADAFVLSSRVEGFPNVVLEALVCGAKVVATPLPGVGNLLASFPDCVLADDVTPEAIAKAVSKATSLRSARRGEGTLSQFGVKQVASRYGEFFIALRAR